MRYTQTVTVIELNFGYNEDNKNVPNILTVELMSESNDFSFDLHYWVPALKQRLLSIFEYDQATADTPPTNF